MIQKTIQYTKFVVAVYFYYDKHLMLLFLGLLREKRSLYVAEDPAKSDSLQGVCSIPRHFEQPALIVEVLFCFCCCFVQGLPLTRAA